MYTTSTTTKTTTIIMKIDYGCCDNGKNSNDMLTVVNINTAGDAEQPERRGEVDTPSETQEPEGAGANAAPRKRDENVVSQDLENLQVSASAFFRLTLGANFIQAAMRKYGSPHIDAGDYKGEHIGLSHLGRIDTAMALSLTKKIEKDHVVVSLANILNHGM